MRGGNAVSADGPRLEEAANGESAENGRAFSADRVGGAAGRDAAGLAEPTTRELVRWLTSQTRPVHRPLFVSTLLRIVNLSLDVVLFGLAAAGAVSSVQGKGLGSYLPVLVLVAMAKAAAYYLEQLTGHYVAFKALELLRTMVFSNLWPKAPAIVGATRSGDVLASLTRDVDRIEVVYAHTFAPVVSALVVPPVFVVGAGLAAGWQAVAIPAACVALALTVVPFVGLRASMRATRRTLELRRELAHHVTDSMFGAEEIIGYGRQLRRLEETDALGRSIGQSAGTARRANAFRRGANVFLALASSIGAAAVATSQGCSPVTVAALAAGCLRLFEGPRGVEDAAGYLDHSLAAARRLWEICHEPPRVADGQETLELAGPAEVSFKSVSYTYAGSPAPALSDFCLDVAAGGHAVLVGPSGSGKTTAASLLLRYDDPDAGEVLLGGTLISRYTLDSLRRCIVGVSQKCELLDASILENVTLGMPDASEEEVWNALEIACLADEVRQMPDGLATGVGVAGRELSGGQAQRLCLARALLMHPKILVLDEFTANLNAELQSKVRVNLRKIPCTILEITHRLDAVAEADLVLLLDRGRTVASGPLDAIESEGSLRDFFTKNL